MKNTGQRLTALSTMSLMDLVEKMNERGVAKDSIVGIIKENEAFILLYYKDCTKNWEK